MSCVCDRLKHTVLEKGAAGEIRHHISLPLFLAPTFPLSLSLLSTYHRHHHRHYSNRLPRCYFWLHYCFCCCCCCSSWYFGLLLRCPPCLKEINLSILRWILIKVIEKVSWDFLTILVTIKHGGQGMRLQNRVMSLGWR